MPGSTAACYLAFMVRRCWPDVVIVVAIVGLTAVGIWAIWGKQIRGDGKAKPTVEKVHGNGET